MVHRYPDGTARGYAALNKPEDWIRSIDFSDRRVGLAQLAGQFEGCASHLIAFITDSDTDPVLRPIYALPVGYRWDRVPGFTLLGDAAHIMSPFAGEGANLALYDGAALAKALVAHPHDVGAALAAYETALFPEAAKSPQRPHRTSPGSSARAHPPASSNSSKGSPAREPDIACRTTLSRMTHGRAKSGVWRRQS